MRNITSENRSSQSIAAWPEDERPRERLLKYGAASLSNAELLAIFLRVGIPGKNARQLASEILDQLGGLRGLYATSDDDLRQIKGLGTAKIAQIKAVIELGKRYLQEQWPQTIQLNTQPVIFNFLAQDMLHLDHEVFKVVLLDNQRKLIKSCELFRGGLTSASVHPEEVIKLALRHKTAGLIFAHNHVNGDTQPSSSDCQITCQMVWACQLMGLHVVDHLIIGNGYYSFAENGLINEYCRKSADIIEQGIAAYPAKK
ncbi:MAG: DNA repair protein RadC [Candidatus Schekmanbacteria bacterium]|nr:DNA repair protein RadC [Candidatus Schekmanbacteria bacterium]